MLVYPKYKSAKNLTSKIIAFRIPHYTPKEYSNGQICHHRLLQKFPQKLPIDEREDAGKRLKLVRDQLQRGQKIHQQILVYSSARHGHPYT